MNSNVKPMTHAVERPLVIERDYAQQGNEIIVIEGVKYDADYFRAFAHPDTDVLYAVRRDEDRVWLTVIRNAEEAKAYFNNTFGLGASLDDTSQAPTEEESDGL